MSQEDLDALVKSKIFNGMPEEEPWQIDAASQGAPLPYSVRQFTDDTVVKYTLA